MADHPNASPTAARGVTGLPTTDRLAEIEAMLDGTTQGTWRWFGDTKNRNLYLATEERGRQFVMCFDRWGMRGAQPTVRSGSNDLAVMVRFEELIASGDVRVDHNTAIIEVCHPDLAFIAAAPSLVRELIEQVRTLLSGAELAGWDRAHAEDLAFKWGDALEQIKALEAEVAELRSAAEQGERDREDAELLAWLEAQEGDVEVDFPGWDADSAAFHAVAIRWSQPGTEPAKPLRDVLRSARQPRQEGDR